MQAEIQRLTSTCGLDLQLRSWWPEEVGGPTDNAIIIMHGLGGHSGRYQHLAAHFTSQGYAVYAPDMVGFGASGGRRGHTPNGIDTHVADLKKCIKRARADLSAAANIILFGHSMGGLTVLRTLLDVPKASDTAIVNAPALNSGRMMSSSRKVIARILNSFRPDITIDHKIDVEKINSDQEVVEQYRQDSLVHQKISIQLALSIMDQGAWVRNHASEYDPGCSLLLLQGENDEIARASDTAKFKRKVACRNSQLVTFPNMKHEVWNEIGKQQALAAIDEFLG